jgi:Spy/CpxP family protein refolding chaperone
MRGPAKFVVACGLAVLMVGLARAQQPSGRVPGGLGAYPGMLLQMERVQKELKLTDEQKDKAKDIGHRLQNEVGDAFPRLRDASPEERPAKIAELIKKHTEALHKELAGTFRPEQMKRFDQIQLQSRGLLAFSGPDVQKNLKLTDEQNEKIKAIVDGVVKEIGELARGSRDETPKKIAAVRKDSMDKIVALFNDDQKKSWKEMTGEPFEFPMQSRRRDQQ